MLIELLDDRCYKGMAYPEGSSSEGIRDWWVKVSPVDVAEARGEWDQVVVIYILVSQQDWEELIVDDVLEFCVQDPPWLLI